MLAMLNYDLVNFGKEAKEHMRNIGLKRMRDLIISFLCAALLLGVLFSAFFIANEYHHDCTGEECPICQIIAECEAFINQIATGLVIAFEAVLVLAAAQDIRVMLGNLLVADTLVTQKVRLNN